jgi:hypothetical protein
MRENSVPSANEISRAAQRSVACEGPTTTAAIIR